jgi:hypothetical protein
MSDTADISATITNSSIFWEPLLNPLFSGCKINQHSSGVIITRWKTDLVLILVVVLVPEQEIPFVVQTLQKGMQQLSKIFV